MTLVTFESVVYVVGCFKDVKYYVMAYALIIITSISVLCIQAANLPCALMGSVVPTHSTSLFY